MHDARLCANELPAVRPCDAASVIVALDRCKASLAVGLRDRLTDVDSRVEHVANDFVLPLLRIQMILRHEWPNDHPSCPVGQACLVQRDQGGAAALGW